MPLPPAPTKRAALLSPDALDAPARPSHRGSRRSGDSRDDASAKSGPQPLELFDNLGTEGGGGTENTAANTRPARRAKSKVAPAPTSNPTPKLSPAPTPAAVSALVSAPQQPAAIQVETRVPTPTPAPAPVAAPQAPARNKRSKSAGPAKLFVLDTNVLLHDPMCLFRFEEHDIFLPMIVLEELDGHKKGTTEVARNGRQTSRTLDALAGAQDADIDKGLKLDTTGHREAGGRLFFQTAPLDYSLPVSLPQGKADNQILGVVQALRNEYATDKPGKPKQEVVLVSKDINMRVKARALGLAADDYQNDKTLEDGDLLYAGSLALPADFWTRQSKTVESWQSGSTTFYRISGPIVPNLYINQFVYFEAPGEPSMYARVTEIRDKTAVLKTLKDYSSGKNAVWGVNTRNREQNFAMNLLMDPEIDFVTLTGTAGTGKTLMALASGLTQVLDDRRYTEIIMTRATVSVGEDIGFLPGTEEEKMGPWMGALDDNLEFLAKGDGGGAGEWGRAATNELIRSRIKVKSMNFMRGRTFLNKYVIIDEAQNLTPKQMKTLITRAGPGTKIICMGNLAQIDTPYLTEGSSGLTFAVDKFKGWPHGGHITLARGERSRLADFASDVL
ncbi:PhoH family protein [Variovorax sp. H27-G14]|uniref:PhoH family protein n=1 Tax=Variovorax sp. H27-G14 TaxID=3111914 RepID=UPI0038FBF1B6